MDDTRWLSADEQRTWRSFLTASRLLWDRVERQLQQGAGLPHAYYEILVRLSEAPDRTLRMSQLASTSLSSRSRLSHAVARMEEAGWVQRRPCPSDKRGQLASLTEAGMERLRAAAPGHVDEVRALLFDRLGPEQQAALREISDILVAHLSPEPLWPAAGDSPADP
ncbi:MarR family winged helix-turn-helix transcriptional regulator [Pseudonocardia abyssalis]|uniref:MarR family transcriptional regulator n=1 Tax=Pseudonocardia abyssalis TaxID=2792008 RepID=A0ABS6UPQ0_9PSEU|nr:MarR family transcriptional regulator [Pseudonocardia abyssalis]MBW0118554.1 MarR family transcriptional regulator [Pseudonocardia abyssalis]MBW0134162.1 MarR family transcriptional regulator [Pseudonocardia abyssalis]